MAQLLCHRKFAHWMVRHRYFVAIEGTLIWTRDTPWADEALHKHPDEHARYQAYLLETVSVRPAGISVPFLANFCENRPAETSHST